MRIVILSLMLTALMAVGGCRKRPLAMTWTKHNVTDQQWREDRAILLKTKGTIDLNERLQPDGQILLHVIADERKIQFVEVQLEQLGYTRVRN